MAADQIQAKRIRVILADDNKEMRDTVVRLLESEFDVVSSVADGRALVDAVTELRPDVGIIDISMPIMNGISAVAEIKRLGSAMKVIFLTVNEDSDFVRAAFETGASGYVVKRQMASDLPTALRETLAGRNFTSPGCELLEEV
jgi:DNA-binding NarL/FixJ family response regulator